MREYLESLWSIRGSDDDFEEDGLHAQGHLGGKFPVHSDDAAVDADLVGLVCGLPGLLYGLSDCRAAGVHVLEGHAERLAEVTDDVQGGVGVLDIVVGEFLALYLTGEGKRIRARDGLRIELRVLMGVLAITEALAQVVFEEELLVQAGLPAHVRGNAHVIFGSMGVGLGGELETGVVGSVPVRAQLLENLSVVGGVADYRHVLPVLGGAAYHRRAAYVDVLDSVLHGHAFARNGLPERIEVHAHEIYGAYALLLEGLHVPGNVTAREYAAMHLGMQCLHPAVEYFGEAGDIGDSDRAHAALLEQPAGAPRGDYLPT